LLPAFLSVTMSGTAVHWMVCRLSIRRLSASSSMSSRNSRLEGQDLPAEDSELARAYLSGEIDAATYQARVRQLVEDEARRAESA
jgi:hypothetical protein